MLKSLLCRNKITPQQELEMKQELDRAVFALQARMERMLHQASLGSGHKLAA